jgi:hypothetical protein
MNDESFAKIRINAEISLSLHSMLGFFILLDHQRATTDMHFTGIIIAICTFLTIGIWHPIVIKTEYHWGTRPWIVYLLVGILCCIAALFVENIYLSSFLGVFGASALWGIGELFSQKKRVQKGWFPMNPKRKHDYE